MERRTFVLRDASIVERFIAKIRADWQGMAALDRPIGVTVAEYRASRSDEQNALMWVWLGFIAEHAVVNGQRFSAEAWNEHMKRELLPERNNKGMDKWATLPDGERQLAMSTRHLDTREMADYMTALEAYAADVLGLELPSPTCTA